MITWRKILREQLSEAQNHRCAYCLCDIRHGATLEHIKPVSRKGWTIFENCIAACVTCNNTRGNGGIWQHFKAMKPVRRANRLTPRYC